MNLDDLITRFSSTTENQSKAIFSTLFIAGNKLQTLFILLSRLYAGIENLKKRISNEEK